MTEYHFDGKEVEERNEDEEEEKKKIPNSSKLRSGWSRLKMWSASWGTKSRVQHEEEEDPRTGPNKDPDESGKKPRTCVGELDTKAETKNSLGG